MAENEIVLRIINELVADEVLSQDSVSGGNMLSNGKVGGRGIKAKTLLAGGVKLLGASGQNEFAQAVGNVSRYTMSGIKIATGNPTAMASLAFDLASQAIMHIKKWQDEQKRSKIEQKIITETTKRKGQIYEHARRYDYGG